MKRAKAITAGAIVLTLALGGGGLWASQYVNAAAASSEAQQEQGAQADSSAAKKDHEGRHGGFGRGFQQMQEQLLTYLGLDEAALQTKLQTSTLAEVAVASGKTRADLKTKLVEWLEAAEAANPKPDAKVEADKLAETGQQQAKPDAAAQAEKLLDSKGLGFGKHGGGFEKNVDGIAAALGITADVLKTELESGKTLAAIAEEKGVAIQVIIDEQVKDQKAKLAEELAAGTITQEQYDTKLAEAVDHATKHVNGEIPARGGHGKGGHGGKGPRGERPSDDAAKSESTTDTSAAATPVPTA